MDGLIGMKIFLCFGDVDQEVIINNIDLQKPIIGVIKENSVGKLEARASLEKEIKINNISYKDVTLYNRYYGKFISDVIHENVTVNYLFASEKVERRSFDSFDAFAEFVTKKGYIYLIGHIEPVKKRKK